MSAITPVAPQGEASFTDTTTDVGHVTVESKQSGAAATKAAASPAKDAREPISQSGLAIIMGVLLGKAPEDEGGKLGVGQPPTGGAMPLTISDVVAKLDELYVQSETLMAGGGSGASAYDGDFDMKGAFDKVTMTKGAPPKDEELVLGWSDLKFSVGSGTKRKEILHGVSGSVRPGNLCAIMGPSGAGKSSLLNIIAGRIKTRGAVTVTGDVTVNGSKVEPAALSRRIAYVMQEDSLFPTQTPREAFRFSAVLRLPKTASRAQVDELVEAMVDALGLRKCCNTNIGNVMIPGLSGGEKKRTAIGVELISNPSILFLDEPTSGLDSFAAFQVVKILKKLSSSGRTVVTTIHQPSSEVFDCFDDVLLIAAGDIVYNAETTKLPTYLTLHGFRCPPRYNPADFVMFLMQTLKAEAITVLAEAWRKHATADLEEGGFGRPAAAASASVVPFAFSASSGPAKRGCGSQFWELAKREMINFIRDKRSLIARIFTTCFLNLLIGVVYQGAANWSDVTTPQEAGSRARAHFGAIVNIFIGAMMGLSQPTLLNFPMERPVFLREYRLGTYGAVPYVVSKILVEIPVTIAQCMLIFLCTYWFLEVKINFMLGVVFCALLGIVGSSLALAVGAVSDNVNVAMQMVPLLFIPQLLFAGLFVPINDIPAWIRWPQYMCFLKYALNLILIAEFGGVGVPNGFNASGNLTDNSLFDNAVWGCSGDALMSNFTCLTKPRGFDSALMNATEVEYSMWPVYLVILLAIFVVFRILSLFLLMKKAEV